MRPPASAARIVSTPPDLTSMRRFCNARPVLGRSRAMRAGRSIGEAERLGCGPVQAQPELQLLTRQGLDVDRLQLQPSAGCAAARPGSAAMVANAGHQGGAESVANTCSQSEPKPIHPTHLLVLPYRSVFQAQGSRPLHVAAHAVRNDLN